MFFYLIPFSKSIQCVYQTFNTVSKCPCCSLYLAAACWVWCSVES